MKKRGKGKEKKEEKNEEDGGNEEKRKNSINVLLYECFTGINGHFTEALPEGSSGEPPPLLPTVGRVVAFSGAVTQSP